MKNSLLLLPALLLFCARANGQFTNPEPFDLSSGFSFSLSSYTGTNFPVNMAIGYESSNINGNFVTPLLNDALHGSAPGKWDDEGIYGISFDGKGSAERGAFLLALRTTGRSGVTVGWRVMVIASGVNTNTIELQYRIGSTGNFTNLANDLYQQSAMPSGTTFSVTLPADANNQPLVQVRWIYYETGNGNRDRLAIDNITVSTALPVELTRFDAQPKGSTVVLYWETATELNNERFIVERSANGSDFSSLESVAGAGTSFVVKTYQFTDRQPLPGRSHYRLQQVDIDGQFSFSPIRPVTMRDAGAIRLFPTLVVGSLQATVAEPSADDLPWAIFDLHGHLLRTGIWPAETSETVLEVSDLPSGNYFFQLAGSTQRFVKQ